MALKQQKVKNQGQVETQGPVMQTDPNPPNPSDQIFLGRALPIVLPRDQVTRRAFSIPVKPPLHYREGVDGAAETVTSRYVNNGQELGIGLGDSQVQVKNGVDTNEFTLRGERIYGT